MPLACSAATGRTQAHQTHISKQELLPYHLLYSSLAYGPLLPCFLPACFKKVLLVLVVVVVVVVLERLLVEVAHIVGVGVAKMLLVGMEAENLLLLLERLLLHVHLREWGWGQGRGRMLLLHERLVRGWHRCHHGGRGKRGRVQR